ncbi:MAG: 3-deoxy-7-phosphoheptulonate synthase [Firmicutes bacterium]|jgi:3-deoxy-7-phosphoheptulonate synthase|nr:3-deoxy-7-phosphoheptulonate synthase [Bacillota bacterium]
MVIVMKPNAPQSEIHRIIEKVKSLGCRIHVSQGENYCLLGLVGHTEKIDLSQLQANEHVDRVIRVQHPFKLVNRLFHPEDTVLDIEGVKVGGGNNVYIAGPCAVESEEQLLTIATAVKEAGAHMLRGGAYKPRTSPYSFQGLEEEGLKIMERVKFETGLPIVTEVMSPDTVEIVASYADVLQIGARNMQNFPLLKAVGETDKPVLLKRGLSATIEEWLMAAEYIMAEGNKKVILCERGIRTFETYTRNTLDLSAVPAVKELSHLPIIVDPSHAAGKWRMVEPLSKAAIAVGADGLIVEVHHQPELAVSDGAQSLKPEKFEKLMKAVRQIAAINEVTRC